MTQILLSTIVTLAVLITGFNTISFDQTKYLSKEYWLKDTKLGAFTELASTDQLSAFPTTYNANLLKTIEVGTTSINSILTLNNLAFTAATRTATIIGGTWQANTLQSLYGGTGTTSMSKWRIVLGNGTASTTVATSTGTAGQFFVSNGEEVNPSWQTKTADEAANYAWTGTHTFSKPVNASSPINASSTLSVAEKLNISTSSPSQLVSLAVNGGALISGTTTVGGLVATTSINASQFSSTATSTFSNGIQLSAGCFKDSVGCVNTKYYSFATSTGTILATQNNVVTVGFTPTVITGTGYYDLATDNDIACSFSWTSLLSIGVIINVSSGSGTETSNANFCRSTQATDKFTLTISGTSETGFTLVTGITAGSITSQKINMMILGN